MKKNRNKDFKQVLRIKSKNIYNKANESSRLFLDFEKKRYEQSVIPFVIMMIIIFIFLILNRFNYCGNILQIKKIYVYFINAFCVEFLIWLAYIIVVLLKYKNCSKSEKKRFEPGKKLKTLIKILLLPLEILVFICKILDMDIMSDYILGFVTSFVFALIFSIIISYMCLLKLDFPLSNKYVFLLILIILFFFLMYVFDWFYFYYICSEDYKNNIEQKDRVFKKMWNQIKQIFFLISIILTFLDYLHGENGNLHYWVMILAVLFSLDTLKHNWDNP